MYLAITISILTGQILFWPISMYVCIFIDCNAGYKEYTQILIHRNKYTNNKRRLYKLIMVGYLFIPIYN